MINKSDSCADRSSFLIDHAYSESNSRERSFEDNAIQGCVNEELEMNASNDSASSEDSLIDINCYPSPQKEVFYEKHKALLLTRSHEKCSMLRLCLSDSDIRHFTDFFSYLYLCAFFSSSSQCVIS